jgi:carbamoyl-phosphate synthase large subunit
MAGARLKELGFTKEIQPKHWCVKEAVFPFNRFPGAAIVLSPEMRSTGEVMGMDDDLGIAYAKTQMAAKPALPLKGKVFISVKDSDKPHVVELAKGFIDLGFTVCSTTNTAKLLSSHGLAVQPVFKLNEGRPNCVDMIKNGEIQFVVNTPRGMIPRQDENAIRAAAYGNNVPISTTLTGAKAALHGIKAMKALQVGVRPIQQYRHNTVPMA